MESYLIKFDFLLDEREKRFFREVHFDLPDYQEEV